MTSLFMFALLCIIMGVVASVVFMLFGAAIRILPALIGLFVLGLVVTLVLGGVGMMIPQNQYHTSVSSQPATTRTQQTTTESPQPSTPKVIREEPWTISRTPLEINLQPGQFVQVKEGQKIPGGWGWFDPKTGQHVGPDKESIREPQVVAVNAKAEVPCPNATWITACIQIPEAGKANVLLNVRQEQIGEWGEGNVIVLEILE